MRQRPLSVRFAGISGRVYERTREKERPFVDEMCDLCWNASIGFRISGRMIFSARQSENRISLENRRGTSAASVARAKRSLRRDLCTESNNRRSCIFLNIWLGKRAKRSIVS